MGEDGYATPVRGRGVYEKSLNLPFSFAVKTSPKKKKKAFKKHTVQFK